MMWAATRVVTALLLALAGIVLVVAADVAMMLAAANTLLVMVVWLGWQGTTEFSGQPSPPRGARNLGYVPRTIYAAAAKVRT